MVRRSVSVWVGWWWPPSPALMTGTSLYCDASSAAPSLGFRIAMMSTYDATVRIVSARLSPFEVELAPGSAKPRVDPPRRSMAASNESRVRVLGSKKSVASTLPRHTSEYESGFFMIVSAREKSLSSSSMVKFPGSIKCLPFTVRSL